MDFQETLQWIANLIGFDKCLCAAHCDLEATPHTKRRRRKKVLNQGQEETYKKRKTERENRK